MLYLQSITDFPGWTSRVRSRSTALRIKKLEAMPLRPLVIAQADILHAKVDG